MGNFNISIRGIGVHHNKKNKNDANRMAAKFVQEMKDAGHSISSATITTGGEDDVAGGEGYLDARDRIETD